LPIPVPARASRCILACVLFVIGPAPTPLRAQPARQPTQPVLGTRTAPIVEKDGLRFRDLDRNGVVDAYEDWRMTPARRADDLVARMTLEEKAGVLMHGTARSVGGFGGMGPATRYDTAANRALIADAKVNSLITRLGGAPADQATENNKLQELAESTRLGIPVTVSSDPRNHFQELLGASARAGRFSQWPETLGFAALGDATLVRRFADVARQEYRAVGIHETLSPQADLATEPRWSRIAGTFGEDAALASRLVRAYVEGFQHGAAGVDSAGVAVVVKHWVGYGAQKNGWDSHNAYGRFASISERSLAYHITPFRAAFAAHVAGVMPTYSILENATLDGRPLEQVGAGFNRQLLTDLLRTREGFRGVILTDWAVTNDCSAACRNGVAAGERPSFANVAMPWGVEDLSKRDRFVKALNAGVDQFGGTEDAAVLVDAVHAGAIPERRLDESVRRILEQKFQLGLFENPFVDSAAAGRVVGNAAFQAQGTRAQQRALVLLENRKRLLPLSRRATRVFLYRIDPAVAARYGLTVVSDPAQADVAIVRADAPFETLHPGFVFGAMQHEGNLGFNDGNADYEAIKRASAVVPTIVTVYLDRPAILTAVRDRASALLANFGVSDAALLDVVTGRARAEGRLPFELPSSMAEVEAQRSDLPHDTAHPLYRFGYAKRY
jgi:beta-glucosidase